ncbi:radical SAM protein, partial [Treponema sp. R8-4-B8]
DFLREAKDYDFSVNILTNLPLLNDEIIAEMKNNRLSSVQVSLYSMDPKIHDAITKTPGSWEKTYNAILKLIENDIPLQISCPVMKQNKDSFTGVILKAEELKTRSTSDFIMMARYDNTTDNLDSRLDINETGEVIKKILEYDRAYQNEINTSDAALVYDDADTAVCGVGISSLCMVAGGNVYP